MCKRSCNLPQQNLKTAVIVDAIVDAMYLFVAGPSTKTKSSALSQSATETICQLACLLVQTAYMYTLRRVQSSEPEVFRATT